MVETLFHVTVDLGQIVGDALGQHSARLLAEAGLDRPVVIISFEYSAEPIEDLRLLLGCNGSR